MAQAPYLIERKYTPLMLHTDNSRVEELIANGNMLAIGLASKGRFEDLEALITKLTTADVVEKFGRTTETAIINNLTSNFPQRYVISPDMANFLLVQIKNGLGQSRSFEKSFEARKQTILEVLVAAGANPFGLMDITTTATQIDQWLAHVPPNGKWDYQGHTLAHIHCLAGDFYEKLQVFLKYGLDVNSTGTIQKYGTFSHILLANEQSDVMLWCIDRLGNRLAVAPRDEEGKTLLIIAAKVRAERVLLKLLHSCNLESDGANPIIDAQDTNGCTTLHYCMALGLKTAAKALISQGANLAVTDNQGRTALDYLDLKPTQIANILRSIEIHPERDACAERNALSFPNTAVSEEIQKKYPMLGRFNLEINGHQIVATKKNIDDTALSAAYQQYGKNAQTYLREQKKNLAGKSLLRHIQEEVGKLKEIFSYLVPTRPTIVVTEKNPPHTYGL